LAANTALGQAAGGDIGYPSPAAALQALHARPGIAFSVENGWTVAADEANDTVWSFAPSGDPTYPAAVKREIVNSPGGLSVRTSILCGGSQAACDKLAVDFENINRALRQRLSSPRHP
jgi:hypothetical protein